MFNRAQAYETALSAVIGALADIVQCNNVSTLWAVWMSVVYEVSVFHRL
jgi:hypothetical protein